MCALRRHGKIYYAYYRATRANGTRCIREMSLATTDYQAARDMEREIMAANRARSRKTRLANRLAELTGTELPAAPTPSMPEPRHRRGKLAELPSIAAKYIAISRTSGYLYAAFLRWALSRGLGYAADITPMLAMQYLGTKPSGKSYNNTRSALNAIFRAAGPEIGLAASPFAALPSRRNNSRHQRPFTEAEFAAIYNAAPEPWKTASLIAWHTGLREKDVFLLQWDMIKYDTNENCKYIITTPAKTRRFGRSVKIPIHPQLAEALDKIPRNGPRILGKWPYKPNSGQFTIQFSQLLQRLKICDTSEGIVSFNSFRDSFISRLDAAGIPRHAIRGMVGHTSDDTTDLYSHDFATAKRILDLRFSDIDI